MSVENKQQKNLDLNTFLFPNLNDAEIAFSTLEADRQLLKEAELRGFYHDNNPYCMIVSRLFYHGGKLRFKEGLDPEHLRLVYRYFVALMRSFAPKHEHKLAICALLLSEIAEPEIIVTEKATQS